MRAAFDRTPWGRLINRNREQLRALRERVDRTERRLDAVENGQRLTQSELAALRDDRLAAVDVRLSAAEEALRSVSDEAVRLRDRVVPAATGRADALLEQLAGEIDEVASLVQRMLRGEPLPVPGESSFDESTMSTALAEIQPALLESFRGSELEISHRLEHYLDALRAAPPVFDLGCGRGELLLMLRDAGVEAAGVEGDAAVAEAARRRGLAVVEGDVLDALRGLPGESQGSVTAIHLFEHLTAERLLAVLAEVRRVLRPGGLLIAECPNPHSLRVGAALFWIDPTHRRPLMPETLELYLTTSGFEVERREPLHPFPDDQLFSTGRPTGSSDEDRLAALGARLDRLCRRLDELINGPRDVAVWARNPESS
jgi:O-antigen chain-terminating methyltransferase